MYVPFDSLPDYSRIWIYQAVAPIPTQSEDFVKNKIKSFCEQWVAHGNPLRTSFKLDHRQFLILAVDEDVHAASGCSIDGSVRVLKELKDETGIDFLDRSNVLFLKAGAVVPVAVKELKQAFTSGILGPNTDTFHVQAPSKGELDKSWIVPVSQTWMSRYTAKTPSV